MPGELYLTAKEIFSLSTTPNRGYPIPDPCKAIHPEVRDALVAIDADVAGLVANERKAQHYGELIKLLITPLSLLVAALALILTIVKEIMR